MNKIPEKHETGRTAESERQLLRRLVDLCEQERQLIAYEIHDGPVQQMTGCLMQLQSLERLLWGEDGQVAKLLQAGMRSLEDGIAEARGLIQGLKLLVLDEAGLIAAIEHLIYKSQYALGPTIDFVHDNQVTRLAPPLEHALFRIAQEGLTNAYRHSGSPRIQITLSQSGDRIRLEIRDWGGGFDAEVVEARHFGLKGIRERARVMGGNACIESALGHGTCITAEFPVAKPYCPE
jgi:signal transduction histidine kinase